MQPYVSELESYSTDNPCNSDTFREEKEKIGRCTRPALGQPTFNASRWNAATNGVCTRVHAGPDSGSSRDALGGIPPWTSYPFRLASRAFGHGPVRVDALPNAWKGGRGCRFDARLASKTLRPGKPTCHNPNRKPDQTRVAGMLGSNPSGSNEFCSRTCRRNAQGADRHALRGIPGQTRGSAVLSAP